MATLAPSRALESPPPPRPLTRQRAFGLEAHLLPVVVIFYACLLPRELMVQVGPVDFGPLRIASLVMLPVALTALKNRPLRLSPLDLLAGFVFTWYLIAAYIVDGFPSGLVRGLGYTSMTGLIYFIARIGVRSHEDFRKLLLMALPGAFVAGVLLFVESITHTPIVRPVIAEVLGRAPPDQMTMVRLGLMRGSGPFTHPILGGVFLASLLPLYWASFARKPMVRLAGLVTSAFGFFTLSSAAILALLMGMGALVVVKLQRLFRVPLFLLGSLVGAITFLALEVLTKYGALHYLLRNLTLNAGTARYRFTIWEHGSIEVMNNPLFGIGERDWVRPLWMIRESVDAYWLFIAMRFGLPASVGMLVLAVCVALLVGHSAKALPRSPARDMHIGIAIALAVIIVSAFTVHLWEGILGLFLMLIAAGVSLNQTAGERSQFLGRKARQSSAPPAERTVKPTAPVPPNPNRWRMPL